MFPMAHLCLAKNILDNTPQIEKPSQFMLGSIAPDSVHLRPGFNSDIKKASHLCVGDEKWGMVTNNEQWTENVLAFLNRNRQSENLDFLLGYCTHILTDLRNNIVFWTPFRLSHQEELARGGGSKIHKENALIDINLYRTSPEQAFIWTLLNNAQGVDLEGMVRRDEIEKLKSNILFQQFADTSPVDLSGNTCITFQEVADFIANELKGIRKQLLSAI